MELFEEFLKEHLSLTLPFSDPVLIFALVMFTILTAPLVFKQIRVPGIVGLILAGTVVGPSVLGFMERDATFILLGTVGLLYLMFTAGLSIDLNQFSKARDKSIVFGFFSFLFPMGLSVWVGTQFLDFYLMSSLLLGSIVGSHTLLAYPIANRIGITKNLGVTMTMGGTIVTDTLSLTVLAVVAATATGEINTNFWLTFAGSVAVYVAAVVIIIPALGRWFFRTVRNQGVVEYTFLLSVLFISAFLAELAGLAAIIGAFLAGLLLNRLVPENSTLMTRVVFVGNALLIPFFLISVGMLVDVAVLVSLEVWLLALSFTALVFVGKSLGVFTTKFIYKLSMPENWTMIGLSTPQAAATLAVTLVGFDLGFFNETVVNAVVIMILITCLIGPLLVENFGRKVARQEEKRPYDPADAPQRILVPLANPATSESLMDLAIMMRKTSSEEPLFPLTVTLDRGDVDAQVAASEKTLSHAVVHAAAADIPVIPVTRVDMNVATAMTRAIKELRISDVIIGWNGEIGPRQRIFGTILDQLLEQTDETAMVCRFNEPLNTAERIKLFIPPLADHEPGFMSTITMIKNLSGQIGAGLVVYGTKDNLSIAKEYITQREPELEATFEELSDWFDLYKTKSLEISENDLVILYGARRDTISWQRSLERLPQLFAKNFDNNLIVIYPSEVVHESNAVLQLNFQRGKIPPLFAPNIDIELDDMSYGKALRYLLENHFYEREKGLNATVERLLKIDPDNMPGELPGVVISHTRTQYVSDPTLFLGISKEGLSHEKVEEKVHVIFLLLTPEDYPVNRCISVLGRIARLIRSKEMVNKLSNVASIQEIRDIFSAKLEFKEEKKSASKDSGSQS